jgi:hypothetical protein
VETNSKELKSIVDCIGKENGESKRETFRERLARGDKKFIIGMGCVLAGCAALWLALMR